MVIEKLEEALADLTSTLLKECIETDLITLKQWNKEIAPKLSKMAMVINDVKVTARTYRLHK